MQKIEKLSNQLEYIYSPTPVGLSSLANEVIVLPLACICKALHI